MEERTVSRSNSLLSTISEAFESHTRTVSSQLGARVASAPFKWVALCVVVVFVCATGWLRFEDETDPKKLFALQHTRALRESRWVERRFDPTSTAWEVYLDRRGDGANILTKDALLEAFEIHDLVEGLTLGSAGDRGSYSDVCTAAYWAPRHGVCQKESILALWDYNRTRLEMDTDVLATVNDAASVPDCCSPASRTVVIDRVVGKITRLGNATSGLVVGAGALRMAYYATPRKHDEDSVIRRYEKKFDGKMRRARLPSFERALPYTVNWGANGNIQAGLDHDRTFIVFAVIVVVAFACLTIGWSHARSDAVYVSRAPLAIAAVGCVGLSMIAAFGIVIGFGITFTPIVSVSALLVLGIGIDDAFVICGCDERYDEDDDIVGSDGSYVLSVEEAATKRVSAALREAGPSVAVTSLSDMAAFLAGSYTAVPALGTFCIFCAASILVDFVMQVTLFVAIFSLDVRRQIRAKRRERPVDAEKKFAVQFSPPSLQPKKVVPVDLVADDASARRPSSFWVRYSQTLLHPACSAVVVGITIVVVALGIVGSVRAKMDFNSAWFLTPGVKNSHVVNAYTFSRTHFKSAGAGGFRSNYVGLYTRSADYYVEREAMCVV